MPSRESIASAPLVSRPGNSESTAMHLPVSGTPIDGLLPILPVGDSPEEIRARVPILKTITDRCYLQLAKDLWSIFHRQLYLNWGFETFDAYILHIGFSKKRVNSLRRIFSVFVMKLGLRPSDLQGLTYSNAVVLLPILDRDNAKEWVEMGKSLPYQRLTEEIHRARLIGVSPADTSSVDLPASPIVLGPNPHLRIKQPLPPKEFRPRTFRLPPEADTL